ncbi:MAG: beta-glucosidase, partial [Cyanobacteria bacterium P01_D01_bin.115]
QILQASTTVQGHLAASPDGVGQSLIMVDDVLSTDWLSPQAAAIALPTAHGYCPRLLDGHDCRLPPTDLDTTLPTLLQIFSRGNPFRDRAGLSEFATQCFAHLNAQNCLVGLAVYGSPYLLEALLAALPAAIPYGFTYSQTPEGQAVLLSQLLSADVVTPHSQAFTD